MTSNHFDPTKFSGWRCVVFAEARYPTQAIGAGAQCYLDFFPDGTPDGTNNGALELESGFGNAQPCPGEWSWTILKEILQDETSVTLWYT